MNDRPEVQDVFRQYGDGYINENASPPHVCKAVRAIRDCRTAALGGHQDICDSCGHIKLSYNSCRNRHCPKCQGLSKERWVMGREVDLLPVPYFHVVFTLPDELNRLIMGNQAALYNLLFKTTAETLNELAANPKHLGARPGMVSVLHTWGQALTLHPHVHMIVPGGGVTTDGKWQSSRKKFFIPVKVLSRKFRGKFLHTLRQMKDSLTVNPNVNWQELMNCLYRKDWYVYCKRPFKTTHSVLTYLGRYTHRVAISNHRIVSVTDGKVSFKWRDYCDRSQEKVMTLPAREFVRRFLLHVLPPGFTKIRHYGFLASAVKRKALVLCRQALSARPPERQILTTAGLMLRLTGRDITCCPHCGSRYPGLSPPEGEVL